MRKNERSSPRVLHAILAQISFGQDQVFDVRTLDLSQGGVLVDCPVSFTVGDTLELAFKVGKHVLNPVSGKVRRVEPAFGGLRFCVAVQFEKPNFQLMELAKRDMKNWEMESDAAGLVSSWTENPMRTFW